MKKVQLFSKQGDLLHECNIPPFDIFPDVILWGQKVYILKTSHDELGIYETCFAISVEYFDDLKMELSKDKTDIIYENIKAAISDESEDADLLPVDLDEAIDLLDTFYREHIPQISDQSEDHFIAHSHHGAGQFIRNNWKLWWSEKNNYGIKEKPKLIEYFHSLGIVHGDDISGIILTSWYRKINNIDQDLPGQVEGYKDYWRKNGFSDGIPKISG